MSGPKGAEQFLQVLVHAPGYERFDKEASPSFDCTALKGLKNIKATEGLVTCSLMVTPAMTNRWGTLHGGATATIVDVVGTAAIVSSGGESGVSVDINVSYLSGMPGGEEVEIAARALQTGRTLGYAQVELRRKSTGKMVAVGRHTKFLPPMSSVSKL